MSGRSLARAAAPAVLIALALTLAGCNSTTSGVAHYESVASDDYRARHPIRIAPAPVTLAIDVAHGARGVTPAQAGSIRGFASSYKSNGQGPVIVSIPVGGADAVAVEKTAHAVIATLHGAGIAYVDKQHTGAHPGAGSVVWITYHAVGARVERCGLWPADAPMTTTHDNRSYHNFGCATQRNLAAQVANPQDLVRPRTLGPSYAARRYVVLKKHAAGESTTTAYDTENEADASTVGN